MAIDTQKFAKQLGICIAKYRQSKGLTQEQVAELLGIGNEAVSRIERGVAMPTLLRILEFADLFECNVADLLVQSSPRQQDKAAYLLNLMENLNENDRTLVIELLERLSLHLQKKDHL
ncbi:helix-turn-helix domain-containing protein [Rodentibacter trehalosifermentans]|uniref:Transcriptional regulator n=1 Tax=Rodentibacter trehalosifermentans TaxID=1908263 RepID=A0A1V3J3G8_9PAST|nr:helix-turn-helix transcriptional regulator [Rodentibacter trehalosifermentans]OOF49554.1 transcriptional regulator [Rodentibacter trehalosifermentans]OOF53473.1 transcriptional regulator [Rodentibacter trehalosifermentans]